jgi:ankyrin repeat protein
VPAYATLDFVQRRWRRLAQVAASADVFALNKKGQSPLYQAVVGAHVASARCLVLNGADANATAKSGLSALHFAARKGVSELL